MCAFRVNLVTFNPKQCQHLREIYRENEESKNSFLTPSWLREVGRGGGVEERRTVNMGQYILRQDFRTAPYIDYVYILRLKRHSVLLFL